MYASDERDVMSGNGGKRGHRGTVTNGVSFVQKTNSAKASFIDDLIIQIECALV